MIKMSYLLEEGASTPEGTVVVTCSKCGRKFALPSGADLLAGNVCEDCAKADAANELAEEKSAELKAAVGD